MQEPRGDTPYVKTPTGDTPRMSESPQFGDTPLGRTLHTKERFFCPGGPGGPGIGPLKRSIWCQENLRGLWVKV